MVRATILTRRPLLPLGQLTCYAGRLTRSTHPIYGCVRPLFLTISLDNGTLGANSCSLNDIDLVCIICLIVRPLDLNRPNRWRPSVLCAVVSVGALPSRYTHCFPTVFVSVPSQKEQLKIRNFWRPATGRSQYFRRSAATLCIPIEIAHSVLGVRIVYLAGYRVGTRNPLEQPKAD